MTKWPPFRRVFRRIFRAWKFCAFIKISLKFIPKGPIDNNPALFQIMAWRQVGDKPLSESMVASLLMHIYVTRPQWVNWSNIGHTSSLLMLVQCWANYHCSLEGWSEEITNAGLNWLAPGRYGSYFRSVISEHILWIKFMGPALGDCHRTSFN